MNREEEIEKETLIYPKEKENIQIYLSQLDDIEWKAYLIAKRHLKTSFHLLKSNGYIEWKSQR